MRLIIGVFLVFHLVSNCQRPGAEVDGMDVVLQFIDNELIQKKMDIRIYDPPPPPELKNSVNHSGRIRPDSIVKNLKPLTVYINDSIYFDANFKSRLEPPKDFSFVNKLSQSTTLPMPFLISSIPKRKGIILESIHLNEFSKILPSIRYQEGYGGLVSFQNLFFSKDGKKAYFEVLFFKGRLNSQTNAVYAKWKNGKWEYIEYVLDVS